MGKVMSGGKLMVGAAGEGEIDHKIR